MFWFLLLFVLFCISLKSPSCSLQFQINIRDYEFKKSTSVFHIYKRDVPHIVWLLCNRSKCFQIKVEDCFQKKRYFQLYYLQFCELIGFLFLVKFKIFGVINFNVKIWLGHCLKELRKKELRITIIALESMYVHRFLLNRYYYYYYLLCSKKWFLFFLETPFIVF